MSEENNIEHFFRKHLDVEHSSNVNEDWKLMEQKLSAAGLGGGIWSNLTLKKVLIILLISSLAAFVIGWFSRALFEVSESSDSRNNTVEIAQPKSNKTNARLTPGITEVEPDSCLAPSETIAEICPPTQAEEKVPAETKISQTILPEASVRAAAGSLGTEIATSDNTKPERLEGQIALNSDDSKQTTHQVSTQSILTESSSVSSIKPPLETGIDENQPIQHLEKLQQPAVAQSDSVDEKKRNKNLLNYRSISVGLSFAPDFNSLGLANEKKVTGKLGAKLFWEFLPRTQLELGVFYNNKKYIASGEQYKPPAGYWAYYTNGEIPTEVDGSCRVIDIPIVLSYRLLDKTKWSLIVAGGVSTYILLDQYYYYRFDQPNPGASEGWNTRENETLKWRIVDLSLGWEYQLNTQTTLRLEPYVQVPMDEVGWGNVSLHGSGVLITYRRKLFKTYDY
ncbi:MAG: hypothetical protein ABJG41_15895 [Cyclobacteriaceae bacterium]